MTEARASRKDAAARRESSGANVKLSERENSISNYTFRDSINPHGTHGTLKLRKKFEEDYGESSKVVREDDSHSLQSKSL